MRPCIDRSAVCLLAAALFVACSSEPAASGSTSGDASAGDGGGSSLAPDGGGDAGCAGDACPKVVGAACDDGDPCTNGDVWGGNGQCTGKPTKCDDGLPCTVDTCDSGKGCTHVPDADHCLIEGTCIAKGTTKPTLCHQCKPAVNAMGWSVLLDAPCNDGDACTGGDVCTPDGQCVGEPLECDDKNPCTFDACVQGKGCQSTQVAAACEDGDPCTAGDVCEAGKCKAGKMTLACDDGDPCTSDTCVSPKGCVSKPNPKACDDGDGCTVDSCDAKKGCDHQQLQAGQTCDDGNACTSGESCNAQLACVGGTPVVCDDANTCTDDACKPELGCLHAFNAVFCDDGESCTTGDVCLAGKCAGGKTASCPVCAPAFSTTAGKITSFDIGSGGVPGSGLDVDGNADTCSPSPGCSGGIDNALSVLSFVANDPLAKAVQTGSAMFVTEFEGFNLGGQPFTLNLYYAVLAADSEKAGCDFQAQTCNYEVFATSLTAACKAQISFANATFKDGVVRAGGPDTIFVVDNDLIGASSTTLFVSGARVEATLELEADGQTVKKMQGIIGGAVSKQSVLETVNALPEATYAPLTKQGVIDLVDAILEQDLDLDGDGKPEASSIGFRFKGIAGHIVGVSQ